MDKNIENIRRRRNNNVSKNNKGLVLFIILILLLIFVYFELYSIISYTLGKKDKNDVLVYKIVNVVNKNFFPENIKVNEEYNLNILSLGDIYLTDKVDKNNDLNDSFKFTKEYLKKFDVVTASLNTPINNIKNKNGYKHNASIKLIDLIKELNISVLATANNHISDYKIEDTINNLSINQVGINNVKPYIIDKNNIKIGILSYLSSDKNIDNVNLLNDENIDNDLKYLNDNNVDCVIAYLNSSNYNSSRISINQKEDVEKLINKGIDIVFCTGSKVINEINEDSYEDNGKLRHTFVVYSMGDFLGEFLTESNKYSLGINIDINKKLVKNGKGEIVDSKCNINIKKPIEFYTKVNSDFSFINYPINYIFKENKDIPEKIHKELIEAEEDINDILNK